MSRFFTMAAVAALAAGGSFAGDHSVLDSAGVQAARIESLWWLFFIICSFVYAFVLIFMVVPLRRADASVKPMALDPPALKPDQASQRRLRRTVSICVGITALVVFGLAISDFLTNRALASLRDESYALSIRITGRQWWWQVEYQSETPTNIVTTANEIHIPVGRVIDLELRSADVIHSFWVPNLHGKKDLVTGHPINTRLRADKAGVYHGQCAEFCGLQHARMKLIVVAEPPELFEKWRFAQLQNAPPPSTDSQKRGYATFMKHTCAICHNIAGAPASGSAGPDLSHVASRRRIAGNSLDNTRDNRRAWIKNPAHWKPGARMPAHDLPEDELEALLDYLETLK